MTHTLPQGFQMRPPTMDDLEAAYKVIETYGIAYFGSPEFTLDELRTNWLSPNFNLQQDAWLIIGPAQQVVGYASMMQREHARIYSEVLVLPGYSDLGIQDCLLGQIEQWAQGQIPLAKPDARIALLCWTSNNDEQGRQSLERQGFKEIRRSWNMEIEMKEAPTEPEWPTGITVRTFRRGDERLVFDTDDEAFQDHWGHMPGNFEEWKHWTVERENFDPTLWFLAFEGERIAGISLCTYRDDTGWVDTLAVLRPWRRVGLGQALMLHSFGEFYRRGTRTVGLGVDAQNLTGATRLYERVGMHVARVYINYEKELRAGIELSTQAIMS
ncbi:MAG TPA: GNAT family N-acetyltransferase [Ktedonobacteraceae bacterium]|nr:GNAT family N-acetyltransferase [Ktedonobacteraceae bacterium]